MALKIVKTCSDCSNRCKQQVDETVWEGAKIIQCPNGKSFKKKKTSQKKRLNTE